MPACVPACCLTCCLLGPQDGNLPKSGTPEHRAVWDKFQELIAAEDWPVSQKEGRKGTRREGASCRVPACSPPPPLSHQHLHLLTPSAMQELAKHDEFRDEINSKRVLCGFEEGLPTWPPTFKAGTVNSNPNAVDLSSTTVQLNTAAPLLTPTPSQGPPREEAIEGISGPGPEGTSVGLHDPTVACLL